MYNKVSYVLCKSMHEVCILLRVQRMQKYRSLACKIKIYAKFWSRRGLWYIVYIMFIVIYSQIIHDYFVSGRLIWRLSFGLVDCFRSLTYLMVTMA